MERRELWKQRNDSSLEKSEQNLKLKHAKGSEIGKRKGNGCGSSPKEDWGKRFNEGLEEDNI